MSPKPRGFLGWLVLAMFLWNGGSGLLRAIGAWQQCALLPEIGLPGWLPGYLLAAGIFTALINLVAFVSILAHSRQAIPLAWAALLVSVGGYWLERLLLWAPDQRSGNVIFMVSFHVLCLIVLGGYTYRESQKRGKDGSGN